MAKVNSTRRGVLKLAGTIWGGALLASQFPTIAIAAGNARERQAFVHLKPAEAAGLKAIASRILPTTDTPGANEAGAIWFIDQVVGAELSDALPLLQGGLAELDKEGGQAFQSLSAATQDKLLRGIEDSEFFGLMRMLTIAGTFAMSEYGGNRDHIGWDLLDFDHRHAWSPPFGYYDAQALPASGNES